MGFGAAAPIAQQHAAAIRPQAAQSFRPVADPRARVVQALAQRGLDTGFR